MNDSQYGWSDAGRVEYRYCTLCAGERTMRLRYDGSWDLVEAHRWITDGLKGLRVDEVFDDDNDADLDDDLAAGSWRLMEERFYQEGIVANLAYKRVTTYVNSHSTTVDAETLYYYGYDQVGNVVFVSEDTDMSTSREFVFHQDAFGNEVSTGVVMCSSEVS